MQISASEKMFSRLFRINDLDKNYRQAIDSTGVYTYPIEPVGVACQKSGFLARNAYGKYDST
jgi:hypothetical protein